VIKTLIKERNRECGIKKREIMSGRKIKKIWEQKTKKVKKHIKNGRRNQKCLFLKLDN
jgi:hypothetical protein